MIRGRHLIRVLTLLRDGWLIFGIAIVMLFALEGAYRGQANLRRALRGPPPTPPQPAAPPHPNESEEWWEEWRAGDRYWGSRYDPYRGLWSRPEEGTYLNIDSMGRRRTVQSVLDSEAVYTTVDLFGGSTMFGYTVRDAWTIPSRLAAQTADDGLTGIEFVNLAQSTFNITQGLNTLTLELRDGRVPDVVIFLDGNNEVAPAFQTGRVGGVLNEDVIAERLNASTPIRTIGEQIADSFELIQRIQRFLHPEQPQEQANVRLARPTPDEICPGVVDAYFGVVSVIQGLASSFGFRALFFWQPMLATTGKNLTAYESFRVRKDSWGATVAACTSLAQATAEERNVENFFDLGGLFDDHEESVFLDDYGHVTEAGSDLIAGAILQRLRPLLSDASGTHRMTGNR